MSTTVTELLNEVRSNIGLEGEGAARPVEGADRLPHTLTLHNTAQD